MGAFAVENARTALEGGARHVTCCAGGTARCAQDYRLLEFRHPLRRRIPARQKEQHAEHDVLEKAVRAERRHSTRMLDGQNQARWHTISVSDIWFVGHYLKKIKTVTGAIQRMTENGVYTDGRQHIEADIVVGSIGFERNARVAGELSGCRDIRTNNYLGKDFMYLADAYIDNNAFNSLFGSSVLEMVKFYTEVFIMFFDQPGFDEMMRTEGIEKIPIEERTWAHYIGGAMALIRKYPAVHKIAKSRSPKGPKISWKRTILKPTSPKTKESGSTPTRNWPAGP